MIFFLFFFCLFLFWIIRIKIHLNDYFRDVTQPGSVSVLGTESHVFESHHFEKRIFYNFKNVIKQDRAVWLARETHDLKVASSNPAPVKSKKRTK